MKICIISNPVAGSLPRKSIHRAVQTLTDAGAEVEIRWTAHAGQATQLARQAAADGNDIVAAAGGDGTINEVVNGLVGTPAALGAIPLGTANCFGHETGIPFQAEKAARILLEGQKRKIPLGRINGRYFILMAGIGFDAEAVYGVNPKIKKKTGKLAYILSGIQAMAAYHPVRLKIRLDGKEELEGYSLIVGNMQYYGGRFVITPMAGLDRDELGVCIFQSNTLLSLFRYAAGILLFSRHTRFRDVFTATAGRVEVSSEQDVARIQIDGEYFSVTPAEIDIVPEAVDAILP